MLIAFRLIQAFASGEHYIRGREELCLAFKETGRRVFEGREFIHAVVNADIWA